MTPRATHPRPPAIRALGLALGLTLAAPPARAQAPAYPQDRDPLQTDSVPLTAPDPAAAKIASEQAPTVTVRLRLVEAVPGGLQDLPAAALAGARLALEAAHEPGAAPWKTCPSCEAELPLGASVCDFCGHVFARERSEKGVLTAFDCMEFSPAHRWIDTLALARKRFPGMANSLDALCKRFKISLTEREKHGALIDARLLAAVYLELKGGRERSLELTTQAMDTAAYAVANPSVYGARPRPLASRSTDAEREVHAAFIREVLKNDELWVRFGL